MNQNLFSKKPNSTTHYTYKTKTPTLPREELHRSFAGVLYNADFSTDRPCPYNLNRIAKTVTDWKKGRI